MFKSLIQAAIVAAGLCAPALAVSNDTGRSDSLPNRTTAQNMGSATDSQGDRWQDRDLMGSDSRELMREAPASSPRGGVAPGRQGQEYRTVPGYIEPGQRGLYEPIRAPEAGRRWGLIVFVVAVVALGLMAFRRRNPMP